MNEPANEMIAAMQRKFDSGEAIAPVMIFYFEEQLAYWHLNDTPAYKLTQDELYLSIGYNIAEQIPAPMSHIYLIIEVDTPGDYRRAVFVSAPPPPAPARAQTWTDKDNLDDSNPGDVVTDMCKIVGLVWAAYHNSKNSG